MADFLRGLQRTVREEAALAARLVQQGWVSPLATRVAEGRAIEGLRLEAVNDDGTATLRCERNESRFREGDALLLHRGDPFASPRYPVALEVDDETQLAVSSALPGAHWGQLLQPPDGWALDEDYHDTSDALLGALAQAGDTAVGRARILPLVMGVARPALDAARYARALDRAEAWGLNAEQAEALAQCYATDLVHLVQGPPGTGKTALLARLAQLLIEDGERVLVTALTHRAINNALNALARAAPDVPAAKIGSHLRAGDLLAGNHASFGVSPLAELAEGYVVGATPFATRTGRLRGVEFDTVICDEASQVTLPLALMGMLVARRYIFIGDHRQLPPVQVGMAPEDRQRLSVFGALVDRGYDTMLTATYRLNDALAQWPSDQFYDGLLHPANEGVARRRLALTHTPERLASILDPDEPLVFVDARHRNSTTRSQREAGAVTDMVVELLACGVPPGEIGVIAPYRAQGRLIRSVLRESIHDPATRGAIVVDTVERMQGQERDVIIVSLTTSNLAFAARVADFFFQPERLNVAITRPRVKLILVGSRHLLETTPTNLEAQIALEQFRALLDHCTYRALPHSE
jgi:DNA replication ATP-dependent helicase Dna2